MRHLLRLRLRKNVHLMKWDMIVKAKTGVIYLAPLPQKVFQRKCSEKAESLDATEDKATEDEATEDTPEDAPEDTKQFYSQTKMFEHQQCLG